MLPKIEKILYATDLGPGSPYVFRYALSLARQYDAKIVIVKAAEPLSTFGQSLVELHISHAQSEEIHRQARQQVKSDIKGRLHAFCEAELTRAEDGEERVEAIEVVEGHPFEVILEQAQKVGADVIVMGTHRHTVLGEAMLGTTAQKVVHSATIPVLLCRLPDGYAEEGA